MVVTFDKEYLKELYEFGKANDKKHRFQPYIVRRYKRCIDIIISVPDVTSLCKYNGLSFEKLSGDKKDFCSVRVNNQYRIEFTTTEVQGEVVTTIYFNISKCLNILCFLVLILEIPKCN